MHLNYDCLRDVLIALEKSLEIINDNGELSYSSVSLEQIASLPDVKGYLYEDVYYVISNLSQAGFIEAQFEFSSDVVSDCVVTDITYQGHMFLRNIHDETIWLALKRRFGPVMNVSLPVIAEFVGQMLLKSST